jgi:glycosyltransferase involved in cell wall biosynthesis
MKYKFTVFTPTYNRAYTLKRVFDSLMSQTINHRYFEWILINDGSTDNTDELVQEFLKKSDFDIKYIKQENKGKNYCHNKAIKLAKGELFLILDSDDAIVSDCMEIFLNYWEKIDNTLKNRIYGISCLCKNGYTNELIGYKVEEGLIRDAFKWKHKNKIYFDGWAALNIKIFKKYLFPEIEAIKFIPESYLWDKVSKNREIYSTNEVLKIVYYQDTGFTKNIINSYKKHSKGRFLYHKMVINDLFWDLLKVNPIRLVKDFIQYGRMGFHNAYDIKKMIKGINKFYKKIIFIFLIPVSYYFYNKDNKYVL